MKDGRPTADDVVLGTKADRDYVFDWLEREYREEGEGFWCNRGMIAKALDDGDFYVIRNGDGAVAFQVGHYGADIANVRKDRQGEGFGAALLDASVARAIRDGVNVLDVECSPRASLTFWEKHGFEQYGDMSDWGRVTARRILPRSLELPADLPRVSVTVSFYPERITYGRGEPVEPLSVHQVSGAYIAEGSLMLDRRVIGFDDAGPDGGDVAVKIEVDGEVRYLGKAKYADEAGVQRDWKGGAFYLDTIEDE